MVFLTAALVFLRKKPIKTNKVVIQLKLKIKKKVFFEITSTVKMCIFMHQFKFYGLKSTTF